MLEIILQLFGGRGGTSGGNSGPTVASTSNVPPAAPPPPSSIPANYRQINGREADDVFDDLEDQYDINTVQAINQYIRQDTQADGFTMSQNMNHKLETDQPLNANEQYVANKLDAAMHPLGQDLILTRAAHKDFLEALGVHNYQNMSPAQLNAAIKGAMYAEKKFVSTAIDPSKNPFMSGPVSGGREVYIHIKAPSSTRVVMGNRDQSEIILGRGVRFRATGAHFDGTFAYPRGGGRLPRVVIEVEIV